MDSMQWAILLALYIVYTIPLYLIAAKSEHEHAWLAFIPLADIWLMCDMADIPLYAVLLCLIPYGVGLFQIIVWWRLAENANKPGILGVLMVIPIINLIVGYYIALYEPKTPRY